MYIGVQEIHKKIISNGGPWPNAYQTGVGVFETNKKKVENSAVYTHDTPLPLFVGELWLRTTHNQCNPPPLLYDYMARLCDSSVPFLKSFCDYWE